MNKFMIEYKLRKNGWAKIDDHTWCSHGVQYVNYNELYGESFIDIYVDRDIDKIGRPTLRLEELNLFYELFSNLKKKRKKNKNV